MFERWWLASFLIDRAGNVLYFCDMCGGLSSFKSVEEVIVGDAENVAGIGAGCRLFE